MSIFEFHLTDFDLENAIISDLDVASRYYKCTLEQQQLLKEIASIGEAIVDQKGVRKGSEIIEFLSAAPFVVSNDFGLVCDPLYKEIRVDNNKIFIKGSDTRFYSILKSMNQEYQLDEVSFKNQSTCRFFFYWIQHGRPAEIELLYDELRRVLDLKKENYKAFVHHERVLSTIKNELNSIGISLVYAKYPQGASRAKGVILRIKSTNEKIQNR